MRAVLTFALALILAATSLSLAAARGEMPRDGRVVLCSAGGPLVVDRDADGTPLAPPHLCPDWALSLCVAAAPPPALPAPRVLRRLPSALALTVSLPGIPRPQRPGAPRGPPARI